MELLKLFCSIDDFWKTFKIEWEKHLIGLGKSRRGPEPGLSISEMMTIIILFHQSNYRTFKHFYYHISTHMRKEFPQIISYSRFVFLTKDLFIPLFAYLLSRSGCVTGISFVDSTPIQVCKIKRGKRNKVFKGIARTGKTSIGWFYGFKLHIIINENGEILSFLVTPGNVSDISVLDKLSKGVFGKIFGDKGYISSKLGKSLFDRGLQLFTTLRSNMKEKLMCLKDKALLRKRSLIETVNDQLKNISQIEHSRHRSPSNFLVNLIGGLLAYSHQKKKPSLNLEGNDNSLMITT